MRSDKLMRFPSLEPAPVRTKDAERERLERDVAEFLKQGGVPTQCYQGQTGYEHNKVKFKVKSEKR